jgi:tetratricopeptide (TPR) repeat protein
MKFLPAKCPNCGGDLQLPENIERLKCMYCACDIIVKEALDQFSKTINLDNLFNLAKIAQDSGNHEEALSYFTKILEFDSNNHQAWFGKGISSGWLSSLSNIRLDELISCVDQAISLAPPNKQADYKIDAALEINNITNALNNIAVKSFKMCITLDSYREFISRMWIFISYYQKASDYKPNDVVLLKNIINAVHQYMQKYECFGGNRKVFLTADGYAGAKQIILETEAKIRNIEPGFNAQIPAHEEGGGCYIATAVYGSYEPDLSASVS